MKKEEWDEEKKEMAISDELETVNQASALWARTEPTSRTSSTTSSTSTSRTTSRSRSPGRTTGSRAAGIHAAALHPGARAVRPVGPRQARRHQALRAARVHHGRRRAADAGLPALRAGRGRFQRPAAQRVARDPAGVARRRGDPRRLDQARAGHARRLANADEQEKKDKYASFWKEFGQVLKEGVGEDCATRSASPSCCASRRRTPTATRRPCRSPTTWRA